MTLPDNTKLVIPFLFPGARNFDDFELSGQGGLHILRWNNDLGPEPTEQQINDAANDLTIVGGQTFSEWLAENGGDPLLTLRRLAKLALDASESNSAILRAVVLELLDHLNSQLAKYNDLLAWLGTQTVLINRAQLNDFAALLPTYAQARSAIKQRVTDGEVDS